VKRHHYEYVAAHCARGVYRICPTFIGSAM
jgi:hypothetical protein